MKKTLKIQLRHIKQILNLSLKKFKKFAKKIFQLNVLNCFILGNMILSQLILNTILTTHYPKKQAKFLINIEMCTFFGLPSLKHKKSVYAKNFLMQLNNYAQLIK